MSTTYYQIILDKSGSMTACKDETLRNLNEHLETVRAMAAQHPGEEFRVSVSAFNEHVREILIDCPLTSFEPIVSSAYMTGGMTALLDAIGSSCQRIQQEHGKEIANGSATVIVVILTDGEENSSRSFSFLDVSKMIEKLEKSEKWTFTFLGADIDAMRTGKMLNIKEQNTMSFSKSRMKETMQDLSHSMDHYMDSKKKSKSIAEFLRIKK